MKFEYRYPNRKTQDDGISNDWIGIAILLMIPFVRVIGVYMLIKKAGQLFRIRRNLNFVYFAAAIILLGSVTDVLGSVFSWVLVSIVVLGLIAFGYVKRGGEGKLDDYLAFIGNRAYVNIDDLASAMGVNEIKLRKDVRKLKETGLLTKDAYIDEGKRILVLRQSEVPQDDASWHKSAPQQKPQPQPKPNDDDLRHSGNHEYDRILREIRALNVAIDDDEVSRKIDRIEEITANIFHLVEQKPERQKDIQAFMEYYLPTTLKLLKQYARLEHQPAYGENITGSKARIESILDKLVAGFEKQLDLLFKSDAIDITSDIKVLEKMMQMDGLADR